MQQKCSPGVSNDDGNFTCFTYDQLKSIAVKHNKKASKGNRIVVSRNKQKLWNNIHKKMKNVCGNDESCWTKDDKVSQERFRPDHPKEWLKNPRTWLSNFDIQSVLLQYETKYPTFKQLGVFPRNYDDTIMNQCVAEELCELDVVALLRQNKYQLGIVFNTDPHYMPGSHWVAVYVNTSPKSDKFGFYYYDSNAERPFSDITKLYHSIKTQIGKTTNKNFEMHVNKVKHQFKNTECGMFSIHFIVQMLKRTNKFAQVVDKKINDDQVFKLRKQFFNRPR